MGEIFSNGSWNFDYFDDHKPPSSSFFPSYFSHELPVPFHQDFSYNFNEIYCPFVEEFTTDSSKNTFDTTSFPVQEDYSLNMVEKEKQEEESGLLVDKLHEMDIKATCRTEPVQIQSPKPPVFDFGARSEPKNRANKSEGQPSKNLMAERRRRKRLNDRLSMLRSIVPKISKMDRTSILGDTIDYTKELLERIKMLKKEIATSSNGLNKYHILKVEKQNEILVRNTPKFDVERRNGDTRIEICCRGDPGLLLSTVTTMEALGIQIQQCVISCFNDFAMDASCSEDLEQRTSMSCDDIKQALFRNAGYAGRCL
ncbi:Transcription factor bHLH93 [Hibiscus syriacus]|uniref:Transcription factor bHLH93 n=2 Tax=Hibiscus syriacus TaxID=106335 RepID=A0A6A2X6C5_HIBSY|nr:Transcription factor bHLH93 [Hibiscus syriacus]